MTPSPTEIPANPDPTAQPPEPEPTLPPIPTQAPTEVPTESAASVDAPAPTGIPPSSAVEALLSSMTLEQKIGQLMVIGFDGEEMSPDLQQMIAETGVGGVIFFARNVSSPQQVAALTANLQTAARDAGKPGLLIAVDQEGGRVARLTERGGFTEFPGAMALGAAGDEQLARDIASAMAQELRALGFNVDFAPDLDVNNNPDNPVIGLRSFSSDPALTAAYGAAFIEGLQSNGVIAFGKHFPGHGDTSVDSHYGLPVVAHERERLEAVEFAPFRAAMQAGVEGIMSAHVVFPAIEPEGLPATLSPRVMTGLIREEMGYTGLLVTDSLEMGALGDSGYPPALAAERAFAAGADLLLFNRDHAMHRAAFDLIVSQVQAGLIPIERVDESARRVLALKERYGLLPGAEQNTLSAPSLDTVGSAEHRELARSAARSSLTVVRAEPGLLPLQPGQPALVVETPEAIGLGELLGLTAYPIRLKPNLDELGVLLNMTEDGRPLIITTADAKTTPEQAALVQGALDAGRQVIVVAVRNPYDIMAFPDVPTYIAAYGSNPPALEAVAGLLRGDYAPTGRLPVELPGLYPLGHGLTGFEGGVP